MDGGFFLGWVIEGEGTDGGAAGGDAAWDGFCGGGEELGAEGGGGGGGLVAGEGAVAVVLVAG